MQGKIQDCKSAFVVDENGNDLKISDRDEVNDLKGQVSNLNSQISSLKNSLPVVSTDGGVILNKQTGEIYGAYVSNQNLDFASSDYDRQFAGNINFSGIYINYFSEQDTAPGNFDYSGKYKARFNSGSINLYFDANRLSGMISGDKTIPVHMYVSFTTI